MEEITIEKAKAFLKEKGYYVDNLWNIEDVQCNYDCTDEQAQAVLHKSLTNEYTVENIFLSISIISEDLNLIEKL